MSRVVEIVAQGEEMVYQFLQAWKLYQDMLVVEISEIIKKLLPLLHTKCGYAQFQCIHVGASHPILKLQAWD